MQALGLFIYRPFYYGTAKHYSFVSFGHKMIQVIQPVQQGYSYCAKKLI